MRDARARLLVTALVASLAVVAAPPVPAGADEEFTLGIKASSGMTIKSVSGGWEVCVGGDVKQPSNRLTGQWALRIVGVRGDVPYVHPTWFSGAFSVFHCETVGKAGTTFGHLTADFEYLAVGDYVIARTTGGALWSPASPDQAYHVEPTP